MGEVDGNDGYPDDWDIRRRRIYRRDNYQCQECGARGGHSGDTELHCHHKDPISQGGGHEPNNLVTLCRNCHNKKHEHQIGDRYNNSGEAIPISDEDIPPSEQVINQEGETLGEFAQRFDELQSSSDTSQSPEEISGDDHSEQTINSTVQSSWSHSISSGTTSTTRPRDNRHEITRADRIITSALLFVLICSLYLILPPVLEINNWISLVVIWGIASYFLT